MGSGSRPWIVLGIAVAVTYLAGIALWGSWATQGAAFTALAVGAVLGSVSAFSRGWIGPLALPTTRERTRVLATASCPFFEGSTYCLGY